MEPYSVLELNHILVQLGSKYSGSYFWSSMHDFTYQGSIVPIPRQIQEFAFPDVVVTWCFPCITPLPVIHLPGVHL